ncbi:MAG: hypothetical protein Tsb002_30370 [Wenzhouxiangellaceae bacterium]
MLALILLFQGISGLPEMALLWRDYQLGLYLSAWSVLLATVNLLPLIAGIVFWWQTDTMTHYLIDHRLRNVAVVQLGTRQALRIALMAIGLLICLQSLPEAAGHGLSLMLNHRDAIGYDLGPWFLTNVIVAAVESLLGILLLLGASPLSRWIAGMWAAPAAPLGSQS